jgi:multicomponent Na+:H+ antiporter subunit D
MIEPIPPAFLFLLGAWLIPLLKGKIKQGYLLFIPALAFIDLLLLKPGTHWVYPFLSYRLVFLQVDRLSIIMGLIFVIIGFLALLYALQVREDGQHVAAFLYVGSSLGVVFAGDFFSLFIFWEIMALTSVFLVWYQREKQSLDAGFRYILMHAFGGACLLAGIVIHYSTEGTLAVGPLKSELAYMLVLTGFGLNTAFIPLHTWLPDAYPEGTVTGSVFLSVYTTKTGVYVLARCFPGAEGVAFMGGAMAVYGVIFALLQNDVRRLLSYHIVSQVGYMVAGVGIGTELGINGGIGHVFNHILYKALLFMCMGSVIFSTGKRKLTELGGLARKMPVTTLTCIIAALSISGAPGFNGFVSKGMVISAAAERHYSLLELMLVLASVGTFLSFVKLCYFTFFAKNDTLEAHEVPFPMQLAMVLTAFLCVFIGVFPRSLYGLLPFPPVEYQAYASPHVLGVVQLFLLAGLVFILAKKQFAPHAGIALDFDYFYRLGGRFLLWFCSAVLNAGRLGYQERFARVVRAAVNFSRNPLWLAEAATRFMELKIHEGFSLGSKHEIDELRSEFKEMYKIGRGYDENFYRRPIGIGVFLALVFLFILGLIYLKA